MDWIRQHKVISAIIGVFFALVIIIIIIFGGGASDSCDNSGGSGASGNWQWPFDGVKDPPQYGEGGQFGDSAASAAIRNGHSFHDGFDWSFGLNGVHAGSTVKAVHDGTVTQVKYYPGLDWYVWVHSDDGFNEVYQETFGQGDIKVKEGDHVNAGDTIGTARLNGHLHLGITKESDFNKAESKAFTNDGTWLDPIKVIQDGMKSASNNNGTASSSGGGDWTKSGTKANKIAKEVFDDWTRRGMSGAQAAGIVGNIGGAEDPTFTLDQRELGGGPGGGLYQFTPYTKYLNNPKSDKSWSVVNQADVVLSLEPQTVKAYVAKQSNSPSQCALDWMNLYERPSYRARALTGGQRSSAAETAYKIFGGASIKGNPSLLGAAANNTSGSTSSVGDNSDCISDNTGSYGGGDILSVAKSLLGYFHYGQVHAVSNIGSVENPNKDGVTDCSGFVWLVLTKAGYKTPDNMGWFTGSMAADARGEHKWLKQIDKKDAKAGDIIIANIGSGAGNSGHTAILEEDWKDGNTKIIQEGGTGGKGGVNESTVALSFGYLFTSGDVVLARPIPK